MEREPLVRPPAMAGELRLVTGIAEDWMAGFGEMDPDLIAAAGFQPDSDLGHPLQPLHHFVMRDGSLADLFVVRGKAVEVFVRGQQRVEGSLVFLKVAGDER